MALLRLNQVEVHVARASGSGSARAPDGLHVWLDVPGGPFEFNAFEVRRGRLVPANAIGGTGRLDTTRAYWSVWSEQSLAIPSRFTRVEGFGYPLPARVRGRRLILPNHRPLAVYSYDLSGAGPANDRITTLQDVATRYYRDLHIEVSFIPRAAPRDFAPLYLLQVRPDRRSGQSAAGRSGYDLTQEALRVVNPDLTGAAWNLPLAASRQALVCYWVADFVNMGAAQGNSWPSAQITGTRISLGEAFRGPPTAYFFMRHFQTSTQVIQAVAHEMAHCLLYEPGLGRAVLQRYNLTAAVRRFVTRLGLGADLYDEIFEGLHAPRGASNLLATDGGTALLPWQVAIIRASTPIGDGA